jgi:RsiW-degrading membrane proteinase PrsW (M82 family)
MSRRRDPVQRRDDDGTDLQGVAAWEPRSLVDRLLYRVYTSLFRVVLVAVAAALLAWQLVDVTAGPILTDPVVLGFVVVSALPALVLAAYVWYDDATTQPRRGLLVVTFVLGLLFVSFAGILNGVGGNAVIRLLDPLSVPESVVFAVLFTVVVAPVEEGIKLLAVRVYAYQSEGFETVISGAVYGAAAGLGFATMENAFIIADQVTETGNLTATATDGGVVTTVRAFVGPGHVIYSAFAGYYLGLARFNRKYAGPIVLKGLLIAVVLHAGYNTLTSTDALYVPGLVADISGLSETASVFTVVLAYNGVLVGVLIYKLSHYRAAYRNAHSDESQESELTEFERSVPVSEGRPRQTGATDADRTGPDETTRQETNHDATKRASTQRVPPETERGVDD